MTQITDITPEEEETVDFGGTLYTLPELQQFAEQIPEIVTALSDVICSFAQIIVDRFYPAILVCVETLMRCGFYIQLRRHIRHSQLAWWIAWHVPSWLIWKLPLRWVSWSSGY